MEGERHSQEQESMRLKAILQEALDLDQDTPERTHAPEAVQLLQSHERDFVNTELEERYWYELSFSLFHIAQDETLASNDSETSIALLIKSLEAAQKGDDPEWTAYVEGSIAYLKKDIATLERIAATDNLNKETLERLLTGLRKRGEPDYFADYYGLSRSN